MAHTNRITEHAVHPTTEEIEAECKMIRAHWSPQTKANRKRKFRFDSGNKQVQANLKFLRFLAEFADANS